MYISIRDGYLPPLGLSSGPETMAFLGIDAFEAEIDRSFLVRSVEGGWESRSDLSKVEDLSRYREELARNQLRVSCLLLDNDFGREDLNAEIDWVVGCADLAKQLGAQSVRIDALMHDAEKTWPEEKRIEVFVQSMQKVIEATAALGTQFGIENHGAQGNDPAFLATIIEQVGSSRLGHTLDTANFYWAGKPLEEVHRILQQFAPSTKHVHMKNIAYPLATREISRELGWRYEELCCALPDGDIDFRQVVGWLREAGYTSDLCIENESLGRYTEEERRLMLRREVEFLKELL